MSDLKLDPLTGDLDISNNEASLTTGLEAKRQHLVQRLSLFFAEWFLNTTEGMPYFQHILAKNPNPVVIDASFKNTIINTPGVTQLESFALDLNTAARNLTLSFKVKTSEGDIEFKDLILP